MTPLKLARIHVCGICEQRCNDPAWLWPRCTHNNRELNDDAFDGEASDCPKGHWDDIEIDLTSAAAIRFQEAPKREYPSPQPSIPAKNQGQLVSLFKQRAALCDACTLDPKCAFKTCKDCRKKALLRRPGMACPHDPPVWLPVVPKKLKVVWILSARDEGPWVEATVGDLKASVKGANFDFEVIVVDDASVDDSCDPEHLKCPVIRNPVSKGIAANFNTATTVALVTHKADIVGYCDAHMTVPLGAIASLVAKASQEQCITMAYSKAMGLSNPYASFGARLVYDLPTHVLAVSWRPEGQPKTAWGPSQAPLGAAYAMSRETIERLSSLSGRLWETVFGSWGWLCEGMGLKCLLMGVPQYVSRDHFFRHFYRRSSPFPGMHIQKTVNVAGAASAMFHPEVFQEVFRPWCVSRKGVTEEMVNQAVEIGSANVVRTWSIEDEIKLLESFPVHQGPESKPFKGSLADVIQGIKV